MDSRVDEMCCVCQIYNLSSQDKEPLMCIIHEPQTPSDATFTSNYFSCAKLLQRPISHPRQAPGLPQPPNATADRICAVEHPGDIVSGRVLARNDRQSSPRGHSADDPGYRAAKVAWSLGGCPLGGAGDGNGSDGGRTT